MVRVKKQSDATKRRIQRERARFFRAQAKLRKQEEEGIEGKKETRSEKQRFYQRMYRERKRMNGDETREKIEEIKVKVRAQLAKKKWNKTKKELWAEEKKRVEMEKKKLAEDYKKRIEEGNRIDTLTIEEMKWIEEKEKIDELEKLEEMKSIEEARRIEEQNAQVKANAKIEEIITKIRTQWAEEKRIAEDKSIIEMRIQEQKKINEQKRIQEQRRIEAKKAQTISNFKYHRLVKYTDAQIAAGENFDRIMSQIQMLNCPNCSRTYPTSSNLSLKSSQFCQECLVYQGKKFTAANRMDPGPVPPELSNLTYIEQMLIAQIHPVVSFYKFDNKIDYAYRGNVVNFRQDINEYAKILPVRPSELACTVFFGRDTIPCGLENFRVRADRIRKALYWLKENNIYYRDIEISEYNLGLLPEDGDVANEIVSVPINKQENQEEYEINNQFKIIASDHDYLKSKIKTKERYVPLLQPIDDEQNYLNEFTELGCITRAFPVLFPTGTADLNDQSREIPIEPEQYFHYLMQYRDRRFVKDDRFRFFAFNFIMRSQAQSCVTNYLNNKLNFEMLKAKLANDLNINSGTPSLLNEMMNCFEGLRSTTPFWRQRSTELLNMCEQIGMPKLMFTLSSADSHHWPDLVRLIAPVGIDPETLTLQERKDLAYENADLVAFFFKERCEIFVEQVLKPIFDVKDSWMRYEWHDGQVELTGLLWLDGLPCLEKDSFSSKDIKQIRKYFDHLCSAINPSLESEEESYTKQHPSRRRFSDVKKHERLRDLTQLLNTVQRHTNCRSNCRLATNNNNQNRKCEFPRTKQEESSIFRTQDCYQYSPARNDQYLQRFNAFVTQIWRTTTDFAPIVSWETVQNFINKNVNSNDETSDSFVNMLKAVLSKETHEVTIKKVIQKLMLITLGDRDYSAPEIIHLLMNWPLCYSTRSFISVKIEGHNVVPKSGLIHKYRFRPETMESWSLATFAKSALILNQVKDSNNRTFVHYIERKEESILCVAPQLKLTGDPQNDEAYYRMQVILHTPFRCDDYSKIPLIRSCRKTNPTKF